MSKTNFSATQGWNNQNAFAKPNNDVDKIDPYKMR
jgi:hypothetical protein